MAIRDVRTVSEKSVGQEAGGEKLVAPVGRRAKGRLVLAQQRKGGRCAVRPQRAPQRPAVHSAAPGGVHRAVRPEEHEMSPGQLEHDPAQVVPFREDATDPVTLRDDDRSDVLVHHLPDRHASSGV